MVLGKNIAHDMKSGAEGAHFFGALLLTFSFDKHKGQRVFGIICLNDPTKDLIEKVKADDQMRLFEYSISYSEII